MQHLKKIPRTSIIQIWPKIWSFIYQRFEKIEVYDFRLKNFGNFCRTRSIFWTVIQDMPKMTLSPWDQHHSWKSQEVWEHLDHSLRNGSQSPERRVDSNPPPASFRVKFQVLFYIETLFKNKYNPNSLHWLGDNYESIYLLAFHNCNFDSIGSETIYNSKNTPQVQFHCIFEVHVLFFLMVVFLFHRFLGIYHLWL